MENENLETDTPINEELEEETLEEEEAEETPKTYSEDEVDELKKKAEVANNYKTRAEKAEKAVKEAIKKQPSPAAEKLTPKDFLAMVEANISSDDYEEVVRISKILDKPIAEALKDKTLKSVLADRAEERRTADVTQTKSPRGGKQNTGEDLLKRVESGNLPEGDAEIAKVAEARLERRRKRLSNN